MNKSYELGPCELLKNSQDLAMLVRSSRLKAGPSGGKLPAQALANAAGVSRDTVFRVERGEDVSFSTAMRILRALGLGLQASAVPWPTLETAHHYFKVEI